MLATRCRLDMFLTSIPDENEDMLRKIPISRRKYIQGLVIAIEDTTGQTTPP